MVDELRSHGLSPRTRTPKTGLTVEIGAGRPAVGFRADLDALPIQEPEGLEFRSEVPSVMHACGHDVHTAIGTGVALCPGPAGASARARFGCIFQPAEETFPAAVRKWCGRARPTVSIPIIAFHVDPTIAAGRIGLRSGAITASADRFYITLEGPGGHTARPHRTVDLIYAAGKVITDLPALLDRLTDSRAPLALVFGKVAGGTADNVIPDHSRALGNLPDSGPGRLGGNSRPCSKGWSMRSPHPPEPR